MPSSRDRQHAGNLTMWRASARRAPVQSFAALGPALVLEGQCNGKSGFGERQGRSTMWKGPWPSNSRVICQWVAPIASINDIECPLGAVSSTTKALWPWLTMPENARKTATSSVQGDCRSSGSSACSAASSFGEPGRHDLVDAALRLVLRVDAAHVRSRHVAAQRSARWAAGSVAIRCTELLHWTSPMARAAATVVVPRPPLPITMISPCPAAANSSSGTRSCGKASTAARFATKVFCARSVAHLTTSVHAMGRQ